MVVLSPIFNPTQHFLRSMEIPIVSATAGVEAGIGASKYQSLIAWFERFSQILVPHGLLIAWSALVLAAIAAFSSILHRKKMVAYSQRGCSDMASLEPLFGFGDASDDETSPSASSGYDSEDPPPPKIEICSGLAAAGEDFRLLQAGSAMSEPLLRNDWSLCLVKGSSSSAFHEENGCGGGFSGSVVQFWNELALGFDRPNHWNLVRFGFDWPEHFFSDYKKSRGRLATVTPVQAVMVSAGQAGMRIWDARVGAHAPASACVVAGVDPGEEEKVYMVDHRGSVVVRDLRNLTSPLEEVAETDEPQRTWFDADAVVVGTDVGPSEKRWGPSVVARCRNAVTAYLF